MVRLDRNCGTVKSLGFNGTSSWGSAGSASATDAQILQSLVDDLPDTILATLAGASQGFHVLGRRFPMPGGGDCDFYDVALASTVHKGSTSTARACFDSTTLLLKNVGYPAVGGTPASQTSFGSWLSISGQMAPGSISRVDGSSHTFSFQANQAAVTPHASDGTFSAAAN